MCLWKNYLFFSSVFCTTLGIWVVSVSGVSLHAFKHDEMRVLDDIPVQINIYVV